MNKTLHLQHLEALAKELWEYGYSLDILTITPHYYEGIYAANKESQHQEIVPEFIDTDYARVTLIKRKDTDA